MAEMEFDEIFDRRRRRRGDFLDAVSLPESGDLPESAPGQEANAGLIVGRTGGRPVIPEVTTEFPTAAPPAQPSSPSTLDAELRLGIGGKPNPADVARDLLGRLMRGDLGGYVRGRRDYATLDPSLFPTPPPNRLVAEPGNLPSRIEDRISPAAVSAPVATAPASTAPPAAPGLLDDLIFGPNTGVSLAGDVVGLTPTGTGPGTLSMTRDATGTFVPSEEPIFDDPATAILEGVARQRLGRLQQPEAASAAENLLNAFGLRRFTELQGAPFSAQEEKALRVRAFDELERQRQVAKQQVIDQLAALGHGRTSGTIVQALNEVDRRFDQIRAQRENDLLTQMIGERQNRQTQALSIAQLLQQTALAGTERGQQREREALAVAALFPELAERRLTLASGALSGTTPSVGSIFQMLASLAGQTQNAQALSSSKSNATMAALGQIIGMVLANPGALQGLGINLG